MIVFSKLGRLPNVIGRWFRQASLYSFLVGAVIIAAAAIGYALHIPNKQVAILFASGGSAAATLIICWAIPKILIAMREQCSDEHVNTVSENKELRVELSRERSARAKLAKQCEDLNQEIERLKRMKVDLNDIRPILKLALLQFEGSLTDFCRRQIGAKEGWLTATSEEYVGAYQIDFLCNIGLDLQKIRIRRDKERLIVSGLKAEFMGFERYDDKPLLREIRKFKERRHLWTTAEIVTEDSRASHFAEEQRSSVRERLQRGVVLHLREEAVRRLGQIFLERILGPLGCKIVFAEGEEPSGLSLTSFLEKHNLELEGEIEKRLAERRRLTEGG